MLDQPDGFVWEHRCGIRLGTMLAKLAYKPLSLDAANRSGN